MKHIKIFVSILATFLFASCDHVAEVDRYIELEPVKAQRVVLLEEFTGQSCINCPKAHEAVKTLQQQYGTSIIPVSIHAGSFAIPDGMFGETFQGLRTEEGDLYAMQLGNPAPPCGVINRNSGVKHDINEWAALVRNELARPTPLDIQINAHCVDGKLQASSMLRSSEPINGYLQLWVLEDSIVSIQLDGSKTITDYVHNNVYRAALNGVGGQSVSLQANVYEEVAASIPIRDKWNPGKLSIVGFVYDDKGVIQAARAAVILEEE